MPTHTHTPAAPWTHRERETLRADFFDLFPADRFIDESGAPREATLGLLFHDLERVPSLAALAILRELAREGVRTPLPGDIKPRVYRMLSDLSTWGPRILPRFSVAPPSDADPRWVDACAVVNALTKHEADALALDLQESPALTRAERLTLQRGGAAARLILAAHEAHRLRELDHAERVAPRRVAS